MAADATLPIVAAMAIEVELLVPSLSATVTVAGPISADMDVGTVTHSTDIPSNYGLVTWDGSVLTVS